MSEESPQRKVTDVELNDKLEVVRAEQRNEHTKTRALVVIFGAPALLAKVGAIFGLIKFPYLF